MLTHYTWDGSQADTGDESVDGDMSSARPDPVFLIGFESGVNTLGQLLDVHPDLSLAREVPAMDGALLGRADPDGLHDVPEGHRSRREEVL